MIEPGLLLAAFFALCAGGMVAAIILPERWNPGAIALVLPVASVLVILACAAVLVSGMPFSASCLSLPSLGPRTIGLDPLAALFLLIAGIVFIPVSFFSWTYLKKFAGHYSLKYFSVVYYLFFASIVFVLIAQDIFSFLVAWELMSITSYLLVIYENEREDSARAGLVMLTMSEAGIMLAALAFILLANAAGGLDFAVIRSAAPAVKADVAWAVFLLSFFGFAVKAGLVPLNSWLPLAHPATPTNVHALLSSAIVNLGIYGIARVNLDLLPVRGVAPGLIVLVFGSFSALIGILYATIQSDLKRLLAYSTIENLGIVATALGAGMIFLAAGHPVVAGIAFIAAFYHMANHSLYKALLLLITGAVDAATGTCDLDRLGGLIRRMPWTSLFVLVGVMSISALPPLNGFVSEWLTLQTILRSALLSSTAIKIVFAVSGSLLALAAGLAVTCFAKVFAMGFLSMPRSEGATHAAEASLGTRVPLALLAILCVVLGVLPTYVIPALDKAVVPLTHESAAAALIPPFFSPAMQREESIPPQFLAEFHELGAQVGSELLPGRGLVVLHRGEERNPVVFAMSTSYMLVALAVVLALSFIAFRLLTRGRTLGRGAVWAGGLRRLRPEMTYSATGFSNPVRVIFHAIVSPATVEDSTKAVAQHFRTAIRREHTDVHIVDRLVLEPPVYGLRWLASIVRRMHVGHVNAYAAYVLLALLLVLVLGAGIH